MSVLIPISIVAILGLAAIARCYRDPRRRTSTGRLSRETKRADSSAPPPGTDPVPFEQEDDVDGRARAEESRRAAESGLPVKAGGTGVVRYEPVDEEELGVTRRHFFNVWILAGLGFSVSTFGAASLAFLWPPGAGGTSGKITVGTLDQVNKAIDDKIPFYNATAKTYIQPYPKADLKKAKKVPTYSAPLLAGMDQGYVALYQKCPHLGCRVPWCQTSQWFECPCHGSKYNRVGESVVVPHHAGMDRFPLEVSGDSIIVDTTVPFQGPPIGTDTTGQGQEGAPCV